MSQNKFQHGKSKRDVVTGNRRSKKRTVLMTAGVLIAGMLVMIFVLGRKPADGDSEMLRASGDVVRIPVSQVNEGRAHFFHYKAGGKDIRLFVLRSSDGVVRAAFDACDVCYPERKGYRQEGDFMVCNNCGNRFPFIRIDVEKSGCNPAPVERKVEGSNLVIKVADIERGAFYF
jgi:uncharacterized membrane protein